MQYWQVVAIVTLTHLAMLFLGMWLQWRRDKAHVQALIEANNEIKAENDHLLHLISDWNGTGFDAEPRGEREVSE